ncbi:MULTISPECIES: DUF4290 domain-containing protein [Olivibacter]|jgi:hypothetical protein|uniref:DUF4290 domain-containing protein n=3 Tax=Sphingobacteriaceae TaxID=84566 RepID=F4C1X6_SPHS2|nr:MULTISPECIES: DUF4290 domain-containing protein [Olivibacter]MCL4640088.1 DUF4290 domain-containing protein [Olivibacter sp. UJ_SKK_5.1]MDM8174719.1 DUF4290 domain-containing protein [Olivibacter sp. 47]MDX3913527.1 DUF4290 domain-containing protein [Pseudosphingobacterium sp.]QEL01510.1 DUF4290 domain-containing protein [Olivibacter sp. LS-1]
MEFDYNSTRKRLILAEYGRNVQNMVAYICTLPTKEERNRHAQVVIDLMGFLNPHLRDVSDFKHKLWDHLHIISDFQIDVDSPYPKPTPGAIHAKPETLNYPQHRIKYKHYGYIIELMIEKAKKIEDPERKKTMVQAMANFMKMAYVTWNKDSVSDDHIVDDLKEMSNGQLVLDEDVNLTKLEFKTPPPGNRTKSNTSSNQQSGGGQKNRQQQHKNQNNGGNKKRKRF